MIKLLEEAFAEAWKLPEQEQDVLSAVILEELAPSVAGTKPLPILQTSLPN